MEDKLYNILEKFIVENNYNLNPEDFKLQLISNPSFPSVKSISDTLDYFGIENIVAHVPKDALEQLPKCFLAVIEEEGAKTIAQVQRKSKNIKLLKDDGKKETLSIEVFKKLWNGTIIAVEEGTENIKKERNVFKNSLVPLSILSLTVLIFFTYKLEPQGLWYLFLTLLGCCCSYLIVRESLGLQNEVSSKICNSAANKTSCNEVINSTSSKFFQLVSLSDASITFFVSMVLVLSILGYNPSFFLSISLLSIPIVLYSIYSQAFEIKKWCPLCLGIASTITGQALLTGLLFSSFEFNASFFIQSMVIVAVVYFAWTYLKNTIKKALQLEQTQSNFLKFKRNESLFDTLLQKEELPSTKKLTSEYQISFGNLNAPIEITSVTNPLCGFCTKAFEGYDALLKTHGEKIKLQIIFNVPVDSLENPATQIAQQIIDIYKENPLKAYQSLQNWFAHRDVDAWQTKYGIPLKNTSLQVLEIHKTWCDLNEINYTPATIIGTNMYPKEYEIKDLSLFIDYLIENKKETKKEPSIH